MFDSPRRTDDPVPESCSARLRWRSSVWAIGLLVVALAVTTLLSAQRASAQLAGAKPTVVLVHGAWADASGWDGVAQRLRGEGFPVVTTT
ncbi:MAG TPA: hypothetical protein VLL25_19490, partial [Acidimicrobiales bacterium]|nr:hypothetical protein [Acidimicrobiales bacterium]